MKVTVKTKNIFYTLGVNSGQIGKTDFSDSYRRL